VFEEDLALGIGGPRLGIWVSLSEFKTGFNIDVSTLRDSTEEGIRAGVEREDGVPCGGGWGPCYVPAFVSGASIAKMKTEYSQPSVEGGA
jgi:hypothetical protein